MPTRATWAEIDLAAYAENLEHIKTCVRPGAKLCVVVKAESPSSMARTISPSQRSARVSSSGRPVSRSPSCFSA